MTEPVPTATASLAEALVLFQTNLPKLGKDKTAKVPTKAGGSYSYSYADLNSITNAVMPLLTACGLSFSTKPRRNDDGTYDLVGVLRHSPSGDTDEGVLPLFTRGTAQETGSSMTYARRYLLTALTGVVPDEDDDGAAAVQAQQRPQNTSQDRPPVDPIELARMQTYNRYKAMNPAATQGDFAKIVEIEFAQPFADVTVEQLQSFYQARP